jgi:hypothetical protein
LGDVARDRVELSSTVPLRRYTNVVSGAERLVERRQDLALDVPEAVSTAAIAVIMTGPRASGALVKILPGVFDRRRASRP